MSETHWLRRQGTILVAIGLVVLLYGFTRLPTLSSDEEAALVAQFRFDRQELPSFTTVPHQSIREVHPQFDHISGWISAVGAAVAVTDLDGDGLANDLCHVDPRVDMVIVSTVPGTGERYPYFVLHPLPLEYNEKTMAPMGCLAGDFNEDGRNDLLVYYWGRSPVVFLSRSTFAHTQLRPEAFRPVDLMPQPEIWNTNAMTQADVDGDGHLDLVVGNYFPDGAPMLDPTSTQEKWEMQDSMSRAYNAGPNRILLWAEATTGEDPTVRFEDVEDVFTPKVAGGWTLALAAADLDGDLLPEIYFANDFGPDRMLYNQSRPGQVRLQLIEGRQTMTMPNSKVLGQDSFKGMGVDFADLNRDGLLDIYVSNIAHEYALEESHFMFLNQGRPELMKEGIAPFEDHSEGLGLSRSFFSWEARLADFNNDGNLEALQATGFVRGEVDRWPELQELAMGNDERIKDPRSWPRFQPGDDLSGHVHNPFFVRSASGRYFDIAEALDLDHSQVSRGIATSDVDGDGDLDFFVANQWDRSYYYRNDSPSAGKSLILRLLHPVDDVSKSVRSRVYENRPREVRGRPAVGATATAKLPDQRHLIGFVDGGNGHSGVRSPEIHFGLGKLEADEVISLQLEWRDDQGKIHQETVSVTPGTHTILLGSSEKTEEEVG